MVLYHHQILWSIAILVHWFGLYGGWHHDCVALLFKLGKVPYWIGFGAHTKAVLWLFFENDIALMMMLCWIVFAVTIGSLSIITNAHFLSVVSLKWDKFWLCIWFLSWPTNIELIHLGTVLMKVFMFCWSQRRWQTIAFMQWKRYCLSVILHGHFLYQVFSGGGIWDCQPLWVWLAYLVVVIRHKNSQKKR